MYYAFKTMAVFYVSYLLLFWLPLWIVVPLSIVLAVLTLWRGYLKIAPPRETYRKPEFRPITVRRLTAQDTK